MTTITRRPGLITFIAVIVYIQAAMAAVGAVVTIAFSGSERVQDAVDVSTGGMIWTGIWEAVLAVLLFLVAGGIMRGSRGFRLLVAIVIGIRMASAVALMLIYHTGGYLFNGLVAVLLGAFVLWALYGYQPADDYFNQQDDLNGRPA
jgi:hypothetical protein